jgi:DNA sulfur modification protein DndB
VIKEKPPNFKFDLPAYLEGALGLLTLDGSERLFTIDGQHRVAGILEAVQERANLGDEELCVILVRGVTADRRAKDPKGFERTRRLFTTLNRYAKPVSKKDIIALDEDDTVAIITRQLVEEYPLFSGNKISIKASKSIPIGDKQSFTSIETLYDTLDIYLADGPKSHWREFKKFRKSDRKIAELYGRAVRLWNTYCTRFEPLNELRASDPKDQVAAKYRHRNGGHMLFRPIGLQMSVKVTRNLMDHNKLSLSEAIKDLAKTPMELSNEPWVNLLWDPTNKRMITAAENQRAAEKLLLHALGGDLKTLRSSPDDLRKELAGVLKKEESTVILPTYVGQN